MAGAKAEVEAMFKQRNLTPVFVQAVQDIPADATVIITTGSPVGPDVLAKAPSLKLVAAAFTGVDHIDLEACRARNIKVSNVPDYSTDATAELVVGLVLSHLRKIPQCQKTILDGSWAAPPQEDLSTKTVGIIGVGKIGLRLTELFKAFKVKGLRGYDPKALPDSTSPARYPGWSPKPQVPKDHDFSLMGGLFVDSLASLFLDCDIICVCLPLTSETTGLITAELMNLLRPNSLLVNVARGGIVDEEALAKLLNQGRFCAAMDVFSTEPLPQESPLRRVSPEFLLMTPHIGYQTRGSLEKRFDITLKNILAFLAGHPVNTVN